MAGTSVTSVPTNQQTSNTGSTTEPQPASANTQTETVMPVTGSHNIWNELIFAFIGTAALAIIANMNESLGKVLLAIMVGFLFMWFLMHSSSIAGWINTAVPQTNPNLT